MFTGDSVEVVRHYIASPDNHLGDVLQGGPAEILDMDSDHNSWVQDYEIVKKIAACLS